jgi:hypothetical protein
MCTKRKLFKICAAGRSTMYNIFRQRAALVFPNEEKTKLDVITAHLYFRKTHNVDSRVDDIFYRALNRRKLDLLLEVELWNKIIEDFRSKTMIKSMELWDQVKSS